jgi:hypothetical protein
MFEYLKDRLWKRIQGWKERMLSRVGKDILIKACAQAIPTFAMSCFDLTKTLCEQMSAIIYRFWWAQQEVENKMHWLSWEVLTKPKSEGGLGFRDLYGFNMAMLAKQAWRMLITPDSLCARVLKAKYFPTTSILEAKPTAGMSYTWRSILKGVGLLREGVVWRIGDGTDVKIWSDPWLPRDDARLPITPKGQCLLTRVCELIDPATLQWDEELIRNIFWQMDVDTILSTPIRDEFEDYYAWQPDSKGNFSVKSAYKLYVRIRDGPTPSSSNETDITKFWKSIWSIPTLPRVQQFIWRMAHNSLPLKMNIKRRGIDCDTLCICCRHLDEDGAHLFCKCKEVQKLWENLGLKDVCDRMAECMTAKAMVDCVLSLLDEERVKVCCLLWRVWTRRNKLNAGETAWSVSETQAQVCYWVGESLLYCRRQKLVNQPSQNDRLAWSPPVGDELKINCDGSYVPITKAGGWGFVIRDGEGAVRGSGAGRINWVASPAQAEAEACIQALRYAADRGMVNVMVESDASNLIRAVHSSEFDRAPEGVLYRDIRIFSQLNFSNCHFMFSPRSCNKVAHALTALGADGASPCRMWHEDVPDSVKVLVASESTVPMY